MMKPETLLREELDKVMKSIGHKEYCVKIKQISTAGANYTSALFLATISIPYEDDLKLFAKIANLNMEMRTNSMLSNAYKNELLFYTDVYEKYRELEEKNKVPKEHRFYVPKYFGSNIQEFAEVLVLEDLTAKSFTLYDRLKPVSWEYAAKSMETLAKFHALSLACQADQPEIFKDLVQTGSESDLDKNKKFEEKFLNRMLEAAYSVVKKENKKRLQNYFEGGDMMNNWVKIMNTAKTPVLSHGDYRPSNLMHRRRNGKLEVVPVDYQTVHRGCPIVDIMYFIYTGTDAQFRKLHYQNLLAHYYSQLSLALDRLNIDISSVYSEEDFESELKTTEMLGLFVGVTVLSIVTVDAESAPKLDMNSNVDNLEIKPSDLYRIRLNEVVDEYVLRGLI